MAKLLPCSARLPVTLALLVAVAAAVGGCATAPSGGPPRPATGGSSQVQAYVQPLPPPGPTTSWGAKDVVLGFLHASASYAFDPAAARQYLVPALRRQWHPGRGPVAVVGAPTGISAVQYHPQLLGPPGGEELVTFTGQHLATLSQSGQYQYAPSQNVPYKFVLAKTNGVWLIQDLPQQQALMLTESDFEDVYQPRNLFFFAPAGPSQAADVLVPDPVYAPLQSSNSALNTDVATRLVNGLLRGQGGWLAGATYSAFPAGTRLLKKVTIVGRTAQVDLGGAAARAQPQVVQQMFDQLLATLSDGQYSAPLARHVQLSINNVPQYLLATNLVPDVPSGTIELITGAGTVGQLPAVPQPRAKPQPRLGPQQIGPAIVTAVAASPADDRPQQLAVAVKNGSGCAVEQRPSGQGAYQSSLLSSAGGACTSLSYDANGNLWAAAGHSVWVLPPGHSPAAVDLSAMSSALQSGGKILALRMAPDAVRAALLVKTSAGNKLLLAAVRLQHGGISLGQAVTIGAGLTDQPLAISWYDAYHLAVLTSAGAGATGGIYSVPLTGGAGHQPAPQLVLTAPPGAQALTTDGSELVVGTANEIFAGTVSAGLSVVASGADPVYPG